MTTRTAPFVALAGALVLSACVVENSVPAPAQPAMRDAHAAAEQACIALVNQNNGYSSAYLVSSEFSQANSLVMLCDGRGDTN